VLAPILRQGFEMMTGIYWDMGENPPPLEKTGRSA